ncbi:hypothetical protein ACQKL6_17525 [Peribacillus sp. NPDC097197]|uniref:hypothetical protein n=1 Tax=unclassified Peribacillus TaxID=2675266 RepID=UPI00388F6F9F
MDNFYEKTVGMTGFIDAYQEKVGTFLFYSQTSIGYVKEGGGYPQLNTGYS